MAHEKDETDPGHVRTVYVGGEGVGAGGADEEGSDTIPETEEADQVEERDAALMLIYASAQNGEMLTQL